MFNCEMHDQPCMRTKWSHQVHYCTLCIVDWYNETDIRRSTLDDFRRRSTGDSTLRYDAHVPDGEGEED